MSACLPAEEVEEVAACGEALGGAGGLRVTHVLTAGEAASSEPACAERLDALALTYLASHWRGSFARLSPGVYGFFLADDAGDALDSLAAAMSTVLFGEAGAGRVTVAPSGDASAVDPAPAIAALAGAFEGGAPSDALNALDQAMSTLLDGIDRLSDAAAEQSAAPASAAPPDQTQTDGQAPEPEAAADLSALPQWRAVQSSTSGLTAALTVVLRRADVAVRQLEAAAEQAGGAASRAEAAAQAVDGAVQSLADAASRSESVPSEAGVSEAATMTVAAAPSWRPDISQAARFSAAMTAMLRQAADAIGRFDSVSEALAERLDSLPAAAPMDAPAANGSADEAATMTVAAAPVEDAAAPSWRPDISQAARFSAAMTAMLRQAADAIGRFDAAAQTLNDRIEALPSVEDVQAAAMAPSPAAAAPAAEEPAPPAADLSSDVAPGATDADEAPNWRVEATQAARFSAAMSVMMRQAAQAVAGFEAASREMAARAAAAPIAGQAEAASSAAQDAPETIDAQTAASEGAEPEEATILDDDHEAPTPADAAAASIAAPAWRLDRSQSARFSAAMTAMLRQAHEAIARFDAASQAASERMSSPVHAPASAPAPAASAARDLGVDASAEGGPDEDVAAHAPPLQIERARAARFAAAMSAMLRQASSAIDRFDAASAEISERARRAPTGEGDVQTMSIVAEAIAELGREQRRLGDALAAGQPATTSSRLAQLQPEVARLAEEVAAQTRGLDRLLADDVAPAASAERLNRLERVCQSTRETSDALAAAIAGLQGVVAPEETAGA